MKKTIILGLYLLFNLSISYGPNKEGKLVVVFTSAFAQSVTLSMQNDDDRLKTHDITISTTGFDQELTNALNSVERVYNINKDSQFPRWLLGIDDISFTAVINDTTYHNIGCRLFISFSQQELILVDCASDEVVFQDTYITLPYESIITKRNHPWTAD